MAKGLLERGCEKAKQPPYNYILKCTATMDFELYRIKKFGVAGLRQPIFLKTFPLQFSPFSQTGKKWPAVHFALSSSAGACGLILGA